MAIYDEMRVQLQELVDLVKQDEQYAAAVAHGAIQADWGSSPARNPNRRIEALFRPELIKEIRLVPRADRLEDGLRFRVHVSAKG